jgi:hypothetical protein
MLNLVFPPLPTYFGGKYHGAHSYSDAIVGSHNTRWLSTVNSIPGSHSYTRMTSDKIQKGI